MRHAPGRRLAKLLRVLRRKNMKIAKLKQELEEVRMGQPRNEKRKTVIPLTEGGSGSVDVTIDFFPSVGDAGACAALGMVGFQAIVDASCERETKE